MKTLFDAIEKAINVRIDKKAGIDYADLIMSGEKKLETRDTDSLRPYVGQRIGIAKTGAGKAKAIGSVEIGEPIVADEKLFRQLQDQHLVPPGTDFDIKPGSVKYLYPVSNPQRFDAPKDVGHGIVARRILGGGILGALGLPENATAADIAFADRPDLSKEGKQEVQQMILDAILGFMSPQPLGDATMDAYNRRMSK